MHKEDYTNAILNAPVYEVAKQTPLQHAPRLSQRLGGTVWLKREDMQSVFSFKLRGAYCKIASLSAEQLAAGVVAASAGNHAQGVALAAHKKGVKAHIVMPVITPRIKVEAVRNLGAEVILHGDSYDEAFLHAKALCEQYEATFIPPYDDPLIIAGQGTVAMEILNQCSDAPQAIFVPVGGGGLAAGMVAYIKAVSPEIKVIGVEPDDSACLKAALDAGERVVLPHVGIFADGTSVKQIGFHPWRILQNNIDDVVTCSSDEICAAIRDVFEDTRSISEPSGALSIAGMKKYMHTHPEIQNVVAIVSGANMNFDRLRYVAERADIGENREALFSVTIPEEAGSFLNFCSMLKDYPITEFNYRVSSHKSAHIFVGIALRSPEEGLLLLQLFKEGGYSAVDMSGNDLAKNHVRYMVGGRANVVNERIFHFEFPERPQALLNFLNKMGARWNISLFHYRNLGASHGRVLVGVQIPENDAINFQNYLNDVGYESTEETDNPSYQFFLK